FAFAVGQRAEALRLAGVGRRRRAAFRHPLRLHLGEPANLAAGLPRPVADVSAEEEVKNRLNSYIRVAHTQRILSRKHERTKTRKTFRKPFSHFRSFVLS